MLLTHEKWVRRGTNSGYLFYYPTTLIRLLTYSFYNILGDQKKNGSFLEHCFSNLDSQTWWDPRSCISNKESDDANAVGPETIFWVARS